MRELKLYLIAVPVMLVLDFVWIGLLMKGFYSEQLGELARRSGGSLAPRWIPAILVYIMIPAGIVLFVHTRSYAGSLGLDFAWGALFGLILYGVYDLTNLATLEQWRLTMTLVDMAWGSFLCGVTSALLGLAKAYVS